MCRRPRQTGQGRYRLGGYYDLEFLLKWKQVLAKAMKDRESQLAGNQGMFLPLLTDAGEQPAGLGTGYEKEDVIGILKRHAFIELASYPG
jgi:hypothetical protein